MGRTEWCPNARGSGVHAMAITEKSFHSCPHNPFSCAYSGEMAGTRMPRLPQLVDYRVVRPTETALALKLVTELGLLRLKTLAR